MQTLLPPISNRTLAITSVAAHRFTWPLVLLVLLTQACSGTGAAQGADTARGVPSAAARRAALSDPETGKIMARLSALSADSMEGRLVGSPGGARARGWIIRELQALGVAPMAGAPMNGAYEQPVKFQGRDGAAIIGANVVARIPGRVPNMRAIVLSAHYDHLGTRNGVVYNGADDDASGCVALLTIAERLKKSGTEHDVILVFFDAEESNLVGANAFVEAPALPLSRIAIDINLDMVSRQDGGALWVSGVSQNAFLKTIVDPLAAAAKVKVLLGHDTKNLKPGDDWTNSSDHGAFNKKGIPFLYLGVEDHSDYHKPGDDPEKIDPTFYRNVIDFSEALLRAVDAGVNKFPAR